MHDTNVDSCPISLVRSIHQFWRRAWYVDLIWVLRSSNQAADSMARIANCSSFDLLFFSDPPAQLHDVLTTDALVLSLWWDCRKTIRKIADYGFRTLAGRPWWMMMMKLASTTDIPAAGTNAQVKLYC
ncbi:hypothetical protein V6N11_061598 [Hibiscus sabdariffa]|uniref:RNase H type-1 domain-containing protein n=1 Tax=Hibiscus sabdariffa TaxID=183260 RepID=A0ABR2A3K0_9ROSI